MTATKNLYLLAAWCACLAAAAPLASAGEDLLTHLAPRHLLPATASDSQTPEEILFSAEDVKTRPRRIDYNKRTTLVYSTKRSLDVTAVTKPALQTNPHPAFDPQAKPVSVSFVGSLSTPAVKESLYDVDSYIYSSHAETGDLRRSSTGHIEDEHRRREEDGQEEYVWEVVSEGYVSNAQLGKLFCGGETPDADYRKLLRCGVTRIVRQLTGSVSFAPSGGSEVAAAARQYS